MRQLATVRFGLHEETIPGDRRLASSRFLKIGVRRTGEGRSWRNASDASRSVLLWLG